MTGNPCWQTIPTKLSEAQFEQFVLPHLAKGHGRRGPAPTLSLHRIFNYVLQVLYMGCQWKTLPIDRNAQGLPEIHYTRIYRIFRRWQAMGCIDAIFAASVRRLHDDRLLDLTVIHDDGTMARRQRRRKAAITSATAATNISKVTRWWLCATATATSSRRSSLLPAIAMNRPCCAMRCPGSARWRALLA